MAMQDLVTDLVALSGGRLVGRTRVQKTIYLLDTQGLGSGASYYYYNFGPFSDEIADGISDGKFTGSLVERISNRQSDGSPFSIFETEKNAADISRLGSMDAADVRPLLERLRSASSTVLELAATIHWLRFVENVGDWRSELKKRKGVKVEGGRMDDAVELLTTLGVAV